MSAGPTRDRLAVWTFQQAGEEIPQGDLSVTDAERSAAGRETIQARWQALLPGNRSRAAAQYAAGGLPDGEDVVRVWRPRDPAELRARLTKPPLAVWAEDDVLHILWQGHADVVQVFGGVQPRLWPVTGTDDLWEASLRIRRLDEAVISPPPGAQGSRSDLRNQEYVPGHNGRRFNAHLRFVIGEVVPWAAEQFGPVGGPWVAAGFSSGAAWAIAAAQRHPDVFGAVAGFSAGIVPQRISSTARAAKVRHYLAAGTLEPGFRRATRQWAERLQRAGLPCRHEEWVGGHDHLWWEQQFPVALGWLLALSLELWRQSGEHHWTAPRLVKALMRSREAARRRKEKARREAHVRRFREDSGNAGMVARELPSDQALASWQHVEQRALSSSSAAIGA